MTIRQAKAPVLSFTQAYIHKSKYSRFLDTLQRRETWTETVDRYMNFMKKQLIDKHNYTMPLCTFHQLRNAILEMRIMPSMRAMMTAGEAAERDNVSCYNCAYSAIDSPLVFSEAMFILLCGTGFGFSAEEQYTKKLPKIKPFKDVDVNSANTMTAEFSNQGMNGSEALDHFVFNFGSGNPKHSIVVGDSKEGWADALKELLNFLYKGIIPSIDTSKVRKKGERLKTFGGRASGPEPLRDLFYFTILVFLHAQGRKLKPIEVHDVMCKIAEVVVVGGTRRCLSASTKVHMANGLYKNIEEVQVGDEVKTPKGSQKVSRVYKQGVQQVTLIVTDFGHIEATENHRHAVATTEGIKFKKVSDIKVGDYLVGEYDKTIGGEWTDRVTDIVRNNREVETYDIEVEHEHVFYAQGFLTHNSALISLTDFSDPDMPSAKSGNWWEIAPHRALANNSAVYESKPPIGDFLREWASLYDSKSGERGIVNRQAMRDIMASNGRREFYKDIGTNPCCFTGDMNLLTDQGYRRFDELAKLYDFNIVSGIDGTVSKGKVWCVGERDVVELEFVDQSKYDKEPEYTYIRCTPNHSFMLEDKTSVRADEVVCKYVVTSGKRNKISYCKSVKYIGKEKVYDFNEPKHNWGVVEGVVAHNSEIILRSRQFCNLTEAVLREDDTFETVSEKVRLASLLGTYQSTLTHFPYLGDRWIKNTEEERLLGVSLTGIFDAVKFMFENENVREDLGKLKDLVVLTNREEAERIGIPASVATTCVKPSGTVSQLVNSASGAHGRHAHYYIRRFRQDIKDPMTQYMIDIGIPHEPDVMNPQNTIVFDTYVKAPESSILREELTAVEHLETWLLLQEAWCEHKPSVTISVKEHEWLDVGAWVYEHFDKMSGVSFLPYDGGSYKQAPYEEITEEQYLEGIKLMPEDPNILDYLVEFDDNVEGAQTLACTGGSCEI